MKILSETKPIVFSPIIILVWSLPFLLVISGQFDFNFPAPVKRVLFDEQYRSWWIDNEPITAVLWLGRFILFLPILGLSSAFQIELDYAFSLVCAGLISSLAIHSTRFIPYLTESSEIRPASSLFPLLWYLLLASQMNGRMLFAFIGTSLLLELFSSAARITPRVVLRFFLALILLSVSTGCLFFGIAFTITWLQPSQLLLVRNSLRRHALLLLIVTLLIVSGLAVFKNLHFFLNSSDGGFSSLLLLLLNHGLGKLLIISLQTYWPLGILLAAIYLWTVLISIFHASREHSSTSYISLFRATAIALLLGLVGLSVASLVIVPLCIFLTYFLNSSLVTRCTA